MKESGYIIKDLTVETAFDAVVLEEKVKGEYSLGEKAVFLDLIEINNEMVEKTPSLQNGFVVYDKEDPIAYLGIHESPVDVQVLQEIPDIPFITQELGGFVTDPEHRSFKFLNTMLQRVLSTQDRDFVYCYSADALVDTSFKGLSKIGVQKWLARNGYSVVVKDEPMEIEVDEDKYEKANSVFLYPSFMAIVASDFSLE